MGPGIGVYAASPLLRQMIRHYVVTPEAPGAGGVFVPYAGCILSLLNRAPLDVGVPARRVGIGGPTLFGPLIEPLAYHREGVVVRSDIAVVFTALGAARLLGVPMDELLGGIVDASALLPERELSSLAARVAAAPDLGAAIGALDVYFIRRLLRSGEAIPERFAALVSLIEGGGGPGRRYDVDTMLETFGTSVRTLRRLAHRYLGMGPKRFLSVIRVNDVIRTLTVGAPNLARVAFDYGYADQAHFARDFHALTTSWPSQYLQRPDHRENDEFMALDAQF